MWLKLKLFYGIYDIYCIFSKRQINEWDKLQNLLYYYTHEKLKITLSFRIPNLKCDSILYFSKKMALLISLKFSCDSIIPNTHVISMSSHQGHVLGKRSCECAAFTSETLEPQHRPIIVKRPMRVSYDQEGQHTCAKMCIALAQAQRDTGPAILCDVIGHAVKIKVQTMPQKH